jgi:TonB-dependent receptor
MRSQTSHLPRFLFALACTLLLTPFRAEAQGTLRGFVADSLSGEPLIGANVVVVGTALGGVTDREGRFQIPNISQQAVTLRVSYLGFSTREVRATTAASVSIRLRPEDLEGEEIVVTAQMRGQTAAINQQLNSNTIVNVVSEEKIQQLPDANAAEAVGRLPGVSLTRSGGEANKVILRGMSDKFTTVTVDGVRIPPTDANERGLDLSMISQGTLAGIELYKALTPDKDADAIAGSINLVTPRAPSERLLRFDLRGGLNALEDALDQYDFQGRYGERFLEQQFGLQLTGNVERRIRSNELLNLDYNTNVDGQGTDWEITNFTLNYTDEVRNRWGAGLLLDYTTPDSGTIRFNNGFSRTDRDYVTFGRNYPTNNTDLLYTARDREQKTSTFNTALLGDNWLFGIRTSWGISYAQSLAETEYDFSMDFLEPPITENDVVISRMQPIPANLLKGPPEALIPLALNNFEAAFANWAYFRGSDNKDRERTFFLDLSKPYTAGDDFAGIVKLGGKYRSKSRFREASEMASPYYIDPFREWSVLADGSIGRKRSNLFVGTSFENLVVSGGRILSTNLLGPSPGGRDIFDRYNLYPIIDEQRLRDWYALNKDGRADSLGSNAEFKRNNETDVDYYDLTERVAAGYAMNTLNFGQLATFIAGVRVEAEDNDYLTRYSPGPLTGFPTPTGQVLDTSASFSETVWLPNFQLAVRPTEYLTVRGAAYRALARPDFNERLPRFTARNSAGVTLYIGNPDLRAAKGWNYELSTSWHSNTIGLLTVSGFYKNITDMFHSVEGVPTKGQDLLDSLGIGWQVPFDPAVQYLLTYPMNSDRPTEVWGFEIEHQANLGFLPGFLQNFTLNWNLSLVRSETYIISYVTETSYQIFVVEGETTRVPVYTNRLTEEKQKLEGQPEFFGNFSLGYDFDGFNARVSAYWQTDFNRTFSANGRTDNVVEGYVRWDLLLRYRFTPLLSVYFAVNNITDTEEGTSIHNRIVGWDLTNTLERYGPTADLGVRLEF